MKMAIAIGTAPSAAPKRSTAASKSCLARRLFPVCVGPATENLSLPSSLLRGDVLGQIGRQSLAGPNQDRDGKWQSHLSTTCLASCGILIGRTPRGWRRPGAPRPTFMRASLTSRPGLRRRPRFLTEKLGLEEIPQRPRRFGVKGPAGREHELRRAGERVDAGRVPSHNRGAGRAEAQGGSVA